MPGALMSSSHPQVLRGVQLELRHLTLGDVSDVYVRWLGDPEIVCFTESRHIVHTIDSVRAYVASCAAGTSEHLFGIFAQPSRRHIGNIKIGPVNTHHQCASVGLIIGEKDCWGKGYATEAIGLAVRHAFSTLRLHKLTAGVVAGNEASLRAFVKNRFVVEGVRRKQNLCSDGWRDETLLGLLQEEYDNA